MNEIFLAASVPPADYPETSDPFLVQSAVRELLKTVIPKYKLVWGGHPTITPLVQSMCEFLGVDAAQATVLYQSQFFVEQAQATNVVLVPAVAKDKDQSLLLMREQMLSRQNLVAAVFIGGMAGAELEHDLFRRLRPDAKVVVVPATGGAALKLATTYGYCETTALNDVDFVRLFHQHFA